MHNSVELVAYVLLYLLLMFTISSFLYTTSTLQKPPEVYIDPKQRAEFRSARGFDLMPQVYKMAEPALRILPDKKPKQATPSPKHKPPKASNFVHRKPTYGEDVEQKLVQWVLERKSACTPISPDLFQSHAQDLVQQERPDVHFSASRGWLSKFLHRNKLSLSPSPKGSRKISYGEDIEKKILDWVLLERPVTTMEDIQRYAQALVRSEMPWLQFSASRGWLEKFLHRNSLCLQRHRVRRVITAMTGKPTTK